MNEIKQNIYRAIYEADAENKQKISALTDRVSLKSYAHLTYECEHGTVWTRALQQALYEHEIVEIDSARTPYYIDDTVIIPSGRRIEAWRAVLCLTPECRVIMFRNEHTLDGTHAPIDESLSDSNISISGGCFAESQTVRKGYGKSGRYSASDDGFFGVSTCMFFDNVENLTLENVTFRNTAGFAVQIGNAKKVSFNNVWFDKCFADGLHINGNSEYILARHIYGEVGDDLVALNAYDWLNSSVNFGPIRYVLCEGLNLAPMSGYKALRFEAGIYTYENGDTVDCALENIIVKNVVGIKTYKMYLQTMPYAIGEEPDKGSTGSMNDIFFENLHIDLHSPIDSFPEYVSGDTVRGTFAAFELGANIGTMEFENIDFIRHGDLYPHSKLLCIGPKSIVINGKEIFDPHISSTAEKLIFKNITVNGKKCEDIRPFVKEIVFDNVNNDGRSTARGKVIDLILQN